MREEGRGGEGGVRARAGTCWENEDAAAAKNSLNFLCKNKKRRRDELRPSVSFARSVASDENLRSPSSLVHLRPSGAHRCCVCQERLSGRRLAADGEKRRASQRGERESASAERERAKEGVSREGGAAAFLLLPLFMCVLNGGADVSLIQLTLPPVSLRTSLQTRVRRAVS